MAQITTPDYGKTKNKGLHTLLELFDRYWTETLEAYQSRDGNTVHEADIQRIKDYLDDMENFISYEEGRKNLDQPHSSNILYAMPEATAPQTEDFQNIFWYTHTVEMYAIRQNIRESQSRNQAQGFHPNDVARWRSYFEDRINFFENFVLKAQPVDLPQSTSNATPYVDDLVDHTPGDSGIIDE